jgi:NAD(P)-dependent dehydrogenase (short-subunit alcohol dehydrogenase family)
MTRSPQQQVVLITGPARGIGAETARRLAARGARLVLVGKEPVRLEALARELGDAHLWYDCDVTDSRALEACVAEAVQHTGRLDAVVANAGIAGRGTVRVGDVDALVRVLDVNLGGVVRTVHATLPHLISSRGYVLLVSSAAAFSAFPGMSTYAASKAGVEHFGNVLRLEVAHLGVQVGVAHMAWIDTDLVRDVQRDSDTFTRTLPTLPGVFGTVTSLNDCADAFVRGIERRARKIWVPSGLSRMALLRSVLNSAWLERWQLRRAVGSVARSEEESAALGRAFGATSVGHGAASGELE